MGFFQYRQATKHLDRLERALLVDRARIEQGTITEDEWGEHVRLQAMKLIPALHDAVHSSPDPRLDLDALVVRARDLCGQIEGPIQGDAADGAAWIDGWLHRYSVANPAREQMLLLALEWRDRNPADGFPPLKPVAQERDAQAERLVDMARRMPDPCAVREAVRAAAVAFDPYFLKNIIDAYVRSGWGDRRLWDAAEAAFDELAVVACSTDPVRTQYYSIGYSLADTAVYILIELAGIPELTGWAVARLPHHRLDEWQVKKLRELVADRAEVFDESLTEEAEHRRSVAAELTLLRVLAAEGVQERPPFA